MNIDYYITSTLFFIWIIRNTFFWVALWQLKEYRFDRVFVHFTETRQGRNLLLSPFLLLKILYIILYGYVVLYSDLLNYYHIGIFAIFLTEVFIVYREIARRMLKRPVITGKAAIIIVLSNIIIYILFLFPLLDKFFWLLLLDRLLPFFIASFVLLFAVPTELYRDFKVQQAIKKLREQKNLLVIGITGSYGKSSTKEYVAQILAKKFRVLKTAGTNNTPIGIAMTVLSGLRKNIEIFVCEMGAYKRGEIAQMCNIAHPTIGVLTAVNEQHVSLFGSIENTMKAKYELIDSLPKDGLALFNGNNQNTVILDQQTQETTKKKSVLYKVYKNELERQQQLHRKPDISAYHVKVEKTAVEFDVQIRNRRIHFTAPVLGAHNIENILPAIYIADYLGMTEKEIKSAVASLDPLSKTMVRHVLQTGAAVIDDTFNSNPDAVIAAISYMKVYNKKRVLVLQPMIELGGKAAQEHYRVAREISTVCDYLFVTNSNFLPAIKKGIKDGGGKCQVKVGNAVEITSFILANAEKGDIFVFEGKEAGIVLDKIL
jgi:UDP-N-acetylmuramoyl-tripeptide--D-alanyl-D-alanine ligase